MRKCRKKGKKKISIKIQRYCGHILDNKTGRFHCKDDSANSDCSNSSDSESDSDLQSSRMVEGESSVLKE